jgi:polyisoprenoid-binding protein YceI
MNLKLKEKKMKLPSTNKRFAGKIMIALVALILPYTAVQAQSFVTEDGYAEFKSNAPLLTFTGTSEKLAGLIDLDENLVDFFLDLETLDTGIRLRNRHMRDSYLETGQYRFAEFTGSLITPFDHKSDEEQQVVVKGEFTMRGITKEMEIEGTLRNNGDNLELEASWVVLLEDFNIRRPRVVFYELAEEQEITISATLKRQ